MGTGQIAALIVAAFSVGTVFGMFVLSWFARKYGYLQEEGPDADPAADSGMCEIHLDEKA